MTANGTYEGERTPKAQSAEPTEVASASYLPSPVEKVRQQVADYERTGGREGGEIDGLPVIVLTTIGAKSGALRKTPLMRIKHGTDYVVVASRGGRDDNPQWYYNLIACPRLQVRDGTDVSARFARQLRGLEYERWWRRAVCVYPFYAIMQAKTKRPFPLFLLEVVCFSEPDIPLT